MTNRHSHSEISTYLDCRAKHHFRYVKRLPIAEQPERPLQGTSVHTGLEHAVVGGLDRLADPVAVVASQTAAVERYRKELVCPADEDILSIRAATRAGIDFLRQADVTQVLAVESKFVVQIGDWEAPGVVDFAYQDSFGGQHILDWKTSNTLPQDTTGTLDPQTALYAYEWMTRHGLTSMFAGRCYLRLAAPSISLTQKGRVSLQSSCSLADYLDFVTTNPDARGTDDDHAKALAKFGPWWRHHEDLVTLDYCRAVLAQWAAAAKEIEQKLPPLANIRPKMCLRCEYLGPCTDWILNPEQSTEEGING